MSARNGAIDIEELDDDTRRRLGVRLPRTSKFSKNDVRTYALRAMAALSSISQQERKRVIAHMASLNRI